MGDECLRKIGGVLSECLRGFCGSSGPVWRRGVCLYLVRYGSRCGGGDGAEDQRSDPGSQAPQREISCHPYVTASFGVTTVTYSPELSPAKIVHLAVQLLYKAKVLGRNCIESAQWNRA